jgi:glycine dehydrogenase subunit 1
MPFIPHTEKDVKEMLNTIGVPSIETLFDEIPANIRSGKLNHVPDGINEAQLNRLMSARVKQDEVALNFIGAGAYEHHIPAVVWDLASRGELMTVYTPYQAEASQGTLQIIYEFQTMMAHLTGMDVSNASLYDGGSALAEAMLMAVRSNRASKSRRILVLGSVHPFYQAAAQNIVGNQDLELISAPFDEKNGHVDVNTLKQFEGGDFAAIAIAQPNFFGVLEDVDEMTNWAHQQKMLVIASVNPTSLGLLTPPGHWGENGADIVVGEAQPLGVPLASGGPYCGFICCKKELVRQMPGRIIGRTTDLNGNSGFVLTLQAREQHIRRGKATSNICTNQGLMMTAVTIYTGLLGFEGLARVAQTCHHHTKLLVERLTKISGVEKVFERPFFHEAVIRLPKNAAQVLAHLADNNILGGFDLSSTHPQFSNCILVCATETKQTEDFDCFANQLESALSQV